MDQSAHKALNTLVDAWSTVVNPNSEEDMVETPELSPDKRAVLMHAIFDKLSEIAPELMTGDIVDNGEDDEPDEDYDADEYARAFETAGDKDMSKFYKAFMGKMRNGVAPWHNNVQAFLRFWADLGNATAAKSPAVDGEIGYRLSVVPDDALEVAGGSLPTPLLMALQRYGFQRNHNDSSLIKYELMGGGDSLPSGFRLDVVRNTNEPTGHYVVTLFANVNTTRDFGRPVRERTLDSSVKTDKIIDVIGQMITRASTHEVVG
jgi:hypothetical protein